MPQQVIDAISNYYRNSNSNTHGAFITTKETDGVIEQARERMAKFLGAVGPETISFGQNMTTLNFSVSKALARFMKQGSEILITQLDHEANRGPWLNLRELGFKIKEANLLADGTLDYDDFQSKLNAQTGLVAVGYASNAVGTVNDLVKIRNWTSHLGVLMLVDAVHYAPHFSIDVAELSCDFLMCSAYKFYGPHVGILYTRHGLLDKLSTDRLVTQDEMAPFSIETGTLNHAALAGVTATIDYLASFGTGPDLRIQLIDAMNSIHDREYKLYEMMYNGLAKIPGLTIIGLPPNPNWHTPTVSFTLDNYTPIEVCDILALKSICAWDGHFYARRAIEAMDLMDRGGVTRLGISMYTNREEVNYTIKCLREIAIGF